jgi:hypothetical protein
LPDVADKAREHPEFPSSLASREYPGYCERARLSSQSRGPSRNERARIFLRKSPTNL